MPNDYVLFDYSKFAEGWAQTEPRNSMTLDYDDNAIHSNNDKLNSIFSCKNSQTKNEEAGAVTSLNTGITAGESQVNGGLTFDNIHI